jgi:phenylalanyl-tRNA synthetase beta chain
LKLSPEKLGEVLNTKVASVEEIIKLGQGLDKVIVSEILAVNPHPYADRLQIAIIDTGKEKKEIVCGAPNIKTGQKVPLATEGAKLPNGLEIKKASIRGVESSGMLCAEDELGLGTDHQGIYILPIECKIGESLTKALGLDDVIFEIENKSITHRPDLFNHYGFAREVSISTGLKFKSLFKKQLIIGKKNINNSPLEIKVLNQKLCPRYMAIKIDGVKILPSPIWLQTKLRNLGFKPINNIVDITNYILLEYGQPLHAFDADKINNKKIIVRTAQKGESLLALDGQKYDLSDEDLIIADSQKPIALAGIIGGEYSGITSSTKNIVIESANFNAANIRRTSWRLGLRTEAVLRFEKSLPLIFTEWGIERAIELIQELAQGKVTSKVYDLKSTEAKKSLKQAKWIIFSPDKARSFIGLDIKNQVIKNILVGLGAEVKIKGRDFLVKPPLSRIDLNIFEDLIEEIVRIYGIEKIIPQPVLGVLKPTLQNQEVIIEEKIKNILVGIGFNEVYNYAFVGEKSLSYFGFKKDYQEVTNPLNKEQQYLRQSLVPGLIANAQKNSQNFSDFKIFESGHVFATEEKKKIGGLIFNKEATEKNDAQDIYQNICQTKCFAIKNILELIFKELGIDLSKIDYPSGISIKGSVYLEKQEIGFIGENGSQAYFELDLDILSSFSKDNKIYQPLSNYPSIKRDLAFLIDKKIKWKEICETIKSIDDLICGLDPFDIFQNKGLGDKCNLGFHIIYQSAEKTLKTEEIEQIQNKIIKIMEEKFKAKLRNF